MYMRYISASDHLPVVICVGNREIIFMQITSSCDTRY